MGLFYVLLLLMPLIAWFKPEYGTDHPHLLKDLCVAGIFFCNGVQLDWELLGGIKAHLRTALTIQLGSVVAVPLLACVLLLTIFPLFYVPSKFTPGVLFTAMLPITTTSCVAFCRLAGVPIFDALINAVIGNLLGMAVLPLISPIIFLQVLDPTFNAMTEAIFTLALLVILPLATGAALKKYFPNFPELHGAGLWMLLYLVYISYCQSFFLTKDSEEAGIARLFFGMLVFHTSATYLAYVIGKLFSSKEETRTTMMLTIPQKTVVLGIPLIDSFTRAMNHEELWLVMLLPLLFYNNIQYIVGGSIAWWIRRGKIKENILM